MRRLLQILSALALVGTITPAVLYLAGMIDHTQVKFWMLAATLLWFATVPLWMGRGKT